MNNASLITEEEGFCPKCSSSDTLWIRAKSKRVCLKCNFTEVFENYSQALVGWRVKIPLQPGTEAERVDKTEQKPGEPKPDGKPRPEIEKLIDLVEPNLTRITIPTRYRDDFNQYLVARKVEQAGPCKTEVWNNIESAYTSFDVLVGGPAAEAIFEEWESGINAP